MVIRSRQQFINTVLHSSHHYFSLRLGLKTRGRKFDTWSHSSRRPYLDALDGASRHPSSGSRLRQITVYLTVDLTYDGWIGGQLAAWIIADVPKWLQQGTARLLWRRPCLLKPINNSYFMQQKSVGSSYTLNFKLCSGLPHKANNVKYFLWWIGSGVFVYTSSRFLAVRLAWNFGWLPQ